MLAIKIPRGKWIAGSCAALLLLCMASPASPAEPINQGAFKVLGPIPKDIKNYGFYYSSEQSHDAYNNKESYGCLRARSLAYDGLKRWQHMLHSDLGKDFRDAQKQSAAAKVATKDPKRKKQIGEWEGQLSVSVRHMDQQIDDEYEAAVKRVHFQITCP